MHPPFIHDAWRESYARADFWGLIAAAHSRLDANRTCAASELENACTNEMIAIAYHELEDFTQSARYWEAASREWTRADEAVDVDANLARVYSNLGRVRLRLNALIEAENALATAQRLLDATSDKTHAAAILINLGHLRMVRSDYQDAQRSLLAAMKVRLEQYGWGDLRFAVVFEQLSRLYYHMGLTVAAERTLRKAMGNCVRYGHEQSIAYANMLIFNAQLLLERGRPSDSERNCRFALSVYRQYLPTEHPRVVNAECWLSRALSRGT